VSYVGAFHRGAMKQRKSLDIRNKTLTAEARPLPLSIMVCDDKYVKWLDFSDNNELPYTVFFQTSVEDYWNQETVCCLWEFEFTLIGGEKNGSYS
jgi:hypothetical protein